MRNFFSIFGQPFRREGDGTGAIPNSLTDAGIKQNGDGGKGAGADWQEHVAPANGRNSLLVPAWFRGTTLIMQTMGQMLVQYQRKNVAGGNYQTDNYGAHRELNYLLQVRPNPLMTASRMLEQIEFKKIYRGNAYVYIERSLTGDVMALWLCDGATYNQTNNTYHVTYNAVGGKRSVITDAENVLHFPNVILYPGMISGVPTLNYALRALQIAATTDTQQLRDMAKGGRYKVIIREDTTPNQGWGASAAGRANGKELKKLTEQFTEDWMSKDAVLLNNIADAKIISQTAAELKILETRGFQVAEIGRLLGVPLTMLMDASGTTYKTPEAATQEFLLRTIQPRIREMEDEFNSKLLGALDFGMRRIHVCEKALRRLDPKAQADLDKIYLETGTSVNEIRADRDLPSIELGDAHYVSTNLAEVGSAKLRDPASPAGAKHTDDEGNDNSNKPSKSNDEGDGDEGQEGGES